MTPPPVGADAGAYSGLGVGVGGDVRTDADVDGLPVSVAWDGVASAPQPAMVAATAATARVSAVKRVLKIITSDILPQIRTQRRR
jgi:hypothetical protein